MMKCDFSIVAKPLIEITRQPGCSPVTLLHTSRIIFQTPAETASRVWYFV